MTVAELMNGLKDYLKEHPNCEDNEVILCDGELMISTVDMENDIVDDFSLGVPEEVCLG
jgi:hypothetical protein